jgi:hypothetical protein
VDVCSDALTLKQFLHLPLEYAQLFWGRCVVDAGANGVNASGEDLDAEVTGGRGHGWRWLVAL